MPVLASGHGGSSQVFLLNWCFDALTSDIKQLYAVGSTLLSSLQELLGYNPHKKTNRPLEGLNNKNKTMKRQAYGLHNSRYAFAG